MSDELTQAAREAVERLRMDRCKCTTDWLGKQCAECQADEALAARLGRAVEAEQARADLAAHRQQPERRCGTCGTAQWCPAASDPNHVRCWTPRAGEECE